MESVARLMLAVAALALWACHDTEPSTEDVLTQAYHFSPESLRDVKSGKINVDIDVLVSQALDDKQPVVARARAMLFAVTADPSSDTCARLAGLLNHETATLRRAATSAQHVCAQTQSAQR